jgi:hypothetical protein
MASTIWPSDGHGTRGCTSHAPPPKLCSRTLIERRVSITCWSRARGIPTRSGVPGVVSGFTPCGEVDHVGGPRTRCNPKAGRSGGAVAAASPCGHVIAPPACRGRSLHFTLSNHGGVSSDRTPPPAATQCWRHNTAPLSLDTRRRGVG